MPERKFYCDICNSEMKCVKTIHPKAGRKFRIRTFKCTVCDFQKDIYADGMIDVPMTEPDKHTCKGCGCVIARGNEWCAECLCEDDMDV